MRPTEAHFNESSSLASIRTFPHKRRTSGNQRRPGRNGPTTFFMRTEDEIDQMSSGVQKSQAESTFGVQSLEDGQTLEDAVAQEELGSVYHLDYIAPLEPRIRESPPQPSPMSSPNLEESDQSSPFQPLSHHLGAIAFSGPLTPLSLRSPAPGSATESAPPSTPKSVSLRSLRLSDDDSGTDDAASQAIASSGEEDDEAEEPEPTESAPQLVMPSITMPRRKPFTERGKNVGKLKIMVAGAKGVGKSSLIRSMVSTCEDIVHVDTPSNSAVILNDPRRRSSGHNSSILLPSETRQLTELYASTRAYPFWWTDLDESRVLRRRRSMNETILDRNLCFIDTPGFCDPPASHSELDSVVGHVENLLWRNQSLESFSDGEILSILSGNGGVQVDLVIYIFSKHFRSIDLDLFCRLSKLTNVVPVIGKADLLSAQEISELRLSILEELKLSDIRPFLFGNSVSELLDTPSTLETFIPYAVSSNLSTDDDNMDASLLMSSAYIQPLIPSDLPQLITRVFDPDSAAWLRHSSARKYLQWRRSTSSHPTSLQPASPEPNTSQPPKPLASMSASATATSPLGSSIALVPRRPPYPSTSLHHAARLADYTEREERLTQVRLARWAADLQRSLQNERERYAGLRRQERKVWLRERMEECDGAVERASGALEFGVGSRRGKGLSVMGGGGADVRDPLGLLEWDDRFRRRGIVVFKVLGGCGVVGALAVWVLRNWGLVGCGFAGRDWGQLWEGGWWGSE